MKVDELELEVITTVMTKRDYFAGQALCGILANSELEKIRQTMESAEKISLSVEKECNVISDISYLYADAMIKESECK